MNFQIDALPADTFAALFQMNDAELMDHQTRRMVVTEAPGAPCRVSLDDAKVGETVILTNYQHQPGNSPYRATHAVYVREGATQATLGINEVPNVIQSRVISLRFFDKDDMIVVADVVPGEDVGGALAEGFEDPAVAYAHIHFAKPGCFAATARRAA